VMNRPLPVARGVSSRPKSCRVRIRPGRTAVDGPDLLVRRGETYELLGPNGVSKTTTLWIGEIHAPSHCAFSSGNSLTHYIQPAIPIAPGIT
jgi:ABC-type hemin transport system ATPase subunit